MRTRSRERRPELVVELRLHGGSGVGCTVNFSKRSAHLSEVSFQDAKGKGRDSDDNAGEAVEGRGEGADHASLMHPNEIRAELVKGIQARLVEERERACDEEVLRIVGDPQDYAEGILKVCKFYLESPLACVSGVTGPKLGTVPETPFRRGSRNRPQCYGNKKDSGATRQD